MALQTVVHLRPQVSFRHPSVQHRKFCFALLFYAYRVRKVFQQLRLRSGPSSAIKAPVKRAVAGGGGGGGGGGWGPETQIHETSLLTPATTRCE